MVELKQDGKIIVVIARGEITGEDYDNLIVPAIKAAHEEFDKLRFLYVLAEGYDGFDRHAMWDDTKIGMSDFTHFEKLGVVSDKKWIRRSIKAFGFLMPGEVKLFHNAELADAEAWIAE